MEELSHKEQNFTKAFSTLDSGYRHYLKVKNHELAGLEEILFQNKIDYQDEIFRSRDAMVQRFEYTLEAFWKYLKLFLETKTGPLQLTGSKNVVREAVRVRLIDESDGVLFLKMIDARNLTSHLYRLEVAQMIEREISGFIEVLRIVSKRMSI